MITQFRTIAVDMIGDGRSGIYKKDDNNFKHSDYAKIILALLDSLRLNKLSAIGASSGGITLLYLNIVQPERFKSVITIRAQIYFSNHIRDWSTKRGSDSANAGSMEWATKEHGKIKNPTNH